MLFQQTYLLAALSSDNSDRVELYNLYLTHDGLVFKSQFFISHITYYYNEHKHNILFLTANQAITGIMVQSNGMKM